MNSLKHSFKNRTGSAVQPEKKTKTSASAGFLAHQTAGELE
jgi:hypothetical protein